MKRGTTAPLADIVTGLDEAEAKLSAFLEPAIKKAETDDVTILLFQRAASGESPLEDWVFTVGEDSVSKLISEILDQAEEDVREYRGRMRYMVRVKGRTKNCLFTLESPSDGEESEIDDMGVPRELANERGIAAQAMRHSEVFAREMLASNRMGREDLHRQNQEYRREIESLRREAHEMRRLMIELQNMQFAREMEIQKFRAEEARKDKAIAALSEFAPAIAAHFFGQQAGAMLMAARQLTAGSPPGAPPAIPGVPGMPGAGASVEVQVMDDMSALIDTVTDTQMASLVQVFTPEQLMMFGKVHNAVLDRKKAADAAKAAAAAAPPPGAPPTNGTSYGGGSTNGFGFGFGAAPGT